MSNKQGHNKRIKSLQHLTRMGNNFYPQQNTKHENHNANNTQCDLHEKRRKGLATKNRGLNTNMPKETHQNK